MFDTDERRRFFRVDDSVGLSYRVLTKDEADVFGEQQVIPTPDAPSALEEFDIQLQSLMSKLHRSDPLVAEVLELFNYKLNTLIGQVDAESHTINRVAYRMQEVNISACGMALASEENLPLDTFLALEVTLQPQGYQLSILAKVVGCYFREEEKDHFLRVDFCQLGQRDQELLIQHIVRRQGALLRMQRALSGDNDTGKE